MRLQWTIESTKIYSFMSVEDTGFPFIPIFLICHPLISTSVIFLNTDIPLILLIRCQS